MKKVNNYTEITEAVDRHFGKTTVTNCFLSRETYDREIACGTLYLEETDGGVYIFRRRDGFDVMYFYLDSTDISPARITTGGDIVCEIPYRERDEKMIAVAERFTECGYDKLFSRVRLAKMAEEDYYTDEHITAADGRDHDSVAALLESSYDRRTGCLPNDESLRDDIDAGRVLVYRDGGIAGLLHYTDDKNMSEIRHVAVDETRRGEGIASHLVRAYLASRTGRCRVWAREDYHSARRIYEKNGYTADGMKSDVLIFRKGTGENNMKEKQKLIAILEDIVPGVDFEAENELIDDGILESLDIVSIVNEIMEQFDVEISVDDLLPENFNSADAILALIKSKQD